jgi:hypothetical protein
MIAEHPGHMPQKLPDHGGVSAGLGTGLPDLDDEILGCLFEFASIAAPGILNRA